MHKSEKFALDVGFEDRFFLFDLKLIIYYSFELL